MFYAHLPTIRIAQSGVLAAVVLGLISACGTTLSQNRSGMSSASVATTALSIDARTAAPARPRAIGQVTPPQTLLQRHPP